MLRRKLQNFVRCGRLTIIDPGGREMTFGAGAGAVPDVTIRIIGALTAIKLALHPDLYLGEAYMEGTLRLERGSLWDFLELCGRNLELHGSDKAGPFGRAVRSLIAAVVQHNSRRSARRNVAHHYDLSNDLYRLFLDDDLQYSCAYFQQPVMSLDDAQIAKKQHIAAKLRLAPGQRILDIGCGWGGLALSLAQMEDVEVLGITLSREQLDVARQRAESLGLSDRVTFELLDYRDVRGSFDRVVSVGMLEHVGAPNYSNFFDIVSRLLAPDGLAVIHSIGRMHGPSLTSSWIHKHIFPGGYIPALSQVVPAIEAAGLWMTDLEILRLHYAQTLRLWRERFLRRRSTAAAIYDEKFCRMWEFYLAVSEMAFRFGDFMVFQVQLSRKLDAVPITRDYLWQAESALGGRFDERRPERQAHATDTALGS